MREDTPAKDHTHAPFVENDSLKEATSELIYSSIIKRDLSSADWTSVASSSPSLETSRYVLFLILSLGQCFNSAEAHGFPDIGFCFFCIFPTAALLPLAFNDLHMIQDYTIK